VARLFDGGVTLEGLPWLALEYVEGVPIDEYCRRYNLSLRHQLELFLTGLFSPALVQWWRISTQRA
jgi:serine/threonine-protein kinase